MTYDHTPRQGPRAASTDAHEQQCEAFWLDSLDPHDIVVVIVADLRQVLGGVESLLSGWDEVPALATTARTTPEHEPVDTGGIVSRADWTAAHSVGAIGWRVPSVVDDPKGYAGLLALADHLGHSTGTRGRLGHTMPLARSGSDALTCTATDTRDVRPALDAVRDQLERLAVGELDLEVDHAVQRARATSAALLDRPRGAATLMARATLLGDDPDAAATWAQKLHDVDTDSVVAAARSLTRNKPMGIVGLPTERPKRSAPASVAMARPVPTVRVERPSLGAAIAVRLPDGADVDQTALAQNGFQLIGEPAGQLVLGTSVGAAPTLANVVRSCLRNAPVRHLVIVGEGSESLEPWRSAPCKPRPDERPRGLRLLPLAGQPRDIASAQLRWPTERAGFIERWLGIALLADLQARSHGSDPHPLAAPEGTLLSLRQEVVPTGKDLVFDVWAAPETLGATLRHLANELSRDRLAERAEHLPDAAIAVAGQWLRTASDGLDLARRATSMLDYGATEQDVLAFDTRLLTTAARDVVEVIRHDTAGMPTGWVRTLRPDLISTADLPWAMGPAKV